MKRKSEYTPAHWAQLYPEQRFAIEQAETDRALGRGIDTMHVRGADGRSTVLVDRATGAPIPAASPRHIGGIVR